MRATWFDFEPLIHRLAETHRDQTVNLTVPHVHKKNPPEAENPGGLEVPLRCRRW